MARGHPVKLGTKRFRNKTEANSFFKAMLNRYTDGEAVGEQDAQFLFPLLERHPDFLPEKRGCGVKSFEVNKSPENTTSCFYALRHDGSKVHFSYITCVKGEAPPRITEVRQAFRAAVEPEIKEKKKTLFAEYKNDDGLVPCAETKEPLGWSDGHMDHRPPMTFQVIVDTFLVHEELEFDDVPITERGQTVGPPKLTDPELGAGFRSWHRKNADLDFVASGVNLSQASKHRRKKTR